MLGFLFVCWLSFQGDSKLPAVDDLFEMDTKHVMALITEKHESAYHFGIEYYFAGDIEGAARFFKHFSLKFPDDHSILYGRAWLHWALEEYEQALRDADFLIRQTKNPVLLARAHFLVGQILKWQENLVKAKRHYQISLELYTSKAMNGGVFRCLIGMASLAYLEGETKAGDQLLERARAIAPTDSPHWEARVFEIQSDSAYLRRDWAKALYYSRRAYEGYASTLVMSALWHQSRMAICNAMLGNYEAAWTLGREVDLKLGELPTLNQHIYYFHNLLWILHARCRGYDMNPMRKSFINWAKDNPTATKELEYFEQCDCPF